MKEKEAEQLRQIDNRLDNVEKRNYKKDKSNILKDTVGSSIYAGSVGALAPLVLTQKTPNSIQKGLESGAFGKTIKNLSQNEFKNAPMLKNLPLQGAGGMLGLGVGAAYGFGKNIISNNNRNN